MIKTKDRDIARVDMIFMFRGYSIAILIDRRSRKVLDFDLDNIPADRKQEAKESLRNNVLFNKRYYDYINNLDNEEIEFLVESY